MFVDLFTYWSLINLLRNGEILIIWKLLLIKCQFINRWIRRDHGLHLFSIIIWFLSNCNWNEALNTFYLVLWTLRLYFYFWSKLKIGGNFVWIGSIIRVLAVLILFQETNINGILTVLARGEEISLFLKNLKSARVCVGGAGNLIRDLGFLGWESITTLSDLFELIKNCWLS